MIIYIYMSGKGFLKEKKFIKLLKEEIKNQFGDLRMDKYLNSDKLFGVIENGYNTSLIIKELSKDFDKVLVSLLSVSNKYDIMLNCIVNEYSEKSIVDYLRDKFKNNNKVCISAKMSL